MDNRWLVLEGDDGGQVYATIPLRLVPNIVVKETGAPGVVFVGTPEPDDHEGWIRLIRVRRLLRELDRSAWPGNDGEGCDMYIRCALPRERTVSGGMGGGRLTDGLWLHDEFSRPEERRRAEQLLME